MKRLDGNTYPTAVNRGSDEAISDLGIGIVHIGVGAFHKAHQAVYTHDALKLHPGDWRILGASLKSKRAGDGLNPQNGAYSLVIRGEGAPNVKIIRSIAKVLSLQSDRRELLDTLVSPTTRIVSMTVTEKAYGVVSGSKKLDLDHESIVADLKCPDKPNGVLGLLVQGLALRMAAGDDPYTVLCCDNLPNNGDLVRSGVIEFASRSGQTKLANWISERGAFPNTMVDRITPASTESLLNEVAEHLGVKDEAAVETEEFSQWVIEDRFVNGRPRWEDVGALFVNDVAPYEKMKLRMLNGSHSLIAYVGFLSGFTYVRDVMADQKLARLVDLHLKAAAKTLEPIPDFDFSEYARDLQRRFRNPSIAHETYQIAMDGSQKMPQRIFSPAVDALVSKQSINSFAFATAAWIRYCGGQDELGVPYELRDPRAIELQSAYKKSGQADEIVRRFLELPGLFPEALSDSEVWHSTVSVYLDMILTTGIHRVCEEMAG